MSQSQRKAREFRRACLEAQLACNAAGNSMSDAADHESEGRIIDAANMIGRASAFVTDAFDAIAEAHAALRGRRDTRAKKNPIERKSSQRIIVEEPNQSVAGNMFAGNAGTVGLEVVNGELRHKAKRTPQESEEERA